MFRVAASNSPIVWSATVSAFRPGAYNTGILRSVAALMSTLAAGPPRGQTISRRCVAASISSAGTPSNPLINTSTPESRALSTPTGNRPARLSIGSNSTSNPSDSSRSIPLGEKFAVTSASTVSVKQSVVLKRAVTERSETRPSA